MAKRVLNPLDEDMRVLGLNTGVLSEQVFLSGAPIEEAKCIEEGKCCPECKGEMKEGKCTKCDYVADAPKDEDEVVDAEPVEEGVDPLDTEEVNMELFDAIMGLPFDNLQAEDIDEILEALKEKTLSEDADEELKARAEEVVDHLLEVKAVRVRRRKAGKAGKKTSKQCPDGYKMKNGACKKVAMGLRLKTARKKKKHAKSGRGKMSAKKSAIRQKRYEGVEESTFAGELMGLLEENVQEEQVTVRDELMDRIGSILEMLSEEFQDEAVERIFEEAYEPVCASYDAGRLDEDLMSEDEFIAEIKPVLTLIHKSLEKIDVEGSLKN